MAQSKDLKTIGIFAAAFAILFGLLNAVGRAVGYFCVQLPYYEREREELLHSEPLKSTGEPLGDFALVMGKSAENAGSLAGLKIALSLSFFFMLSGFVTAVVFLVLGVLLIKKPRKGFAVPLLVISVFSVLPSALTADPWGRILFVLLLAVLGSLIAFLIIYAAEKRSNKHQDT